MGWINTQLGQLEYRFELLRLEVQELWRQLRGVQDGVRNANMQQGGGSSGGGGTFIAYPTAAIATGAFASLTIYQCQGGSKTSVGTFSLYNYLASSIVAGDGSSTFGVMCIPDEAGNYTAMSQSCT